MTCAEAAEGDCAEVQLREGLEAVPVAAAGRTYVSEKTTRTA